MTKSIKILLCISGIYIIYLLIAVFLIIPRTDFYWLAPCTEITFFSLVMADSSGPPFSILWDILFYVALIFVVGLAVIDFLCAFYISKANKPFKRIASYRSLITSLFGICLVIIGRLVFVPLDVMGSPLIIEGLAYFLFYGTIFSLLMINERKEKQ